MVALEDYHMKSDASLSTSASTYTSSSTSSGGEAFGSLAVLVAAQEAWAECEPDCYVLSESIVPSLLEDIARRVPGNRQSRQTLDMIADLFLPAGGKDQRPIFQKMLKARGGQVHFLHFWRAFQEATRLLDNLGSCSDSASEDGRKKGVSAEGLAEEVELVRDTILRTLDMQAEDTNKAYRHQSMSLKELTEMMRGTASMSLAPGFWISLEQGLCKSYAPQPERAGCFGAQGGRKKTDKFSWDDLTSLVISWLREATAYKPAGELARKSSKTRSGDEGLPVYIHIYDVSHEDTVHKLNKVLAHKRNPFKFGGVFHAGIEVNGLEWAFGMSCSETASGIACSLPKEHSEHRYRQSVRLKNTKCSAEEVADLMTQLIEEYPGDDYDLLRRNCCHFADDFARRLGAGRLPGWVHRLARVGSFVDGAMMRISGRGLLPEDEDMF